MVKIIIFTITLYHSSLQLYAACCWLVRFSKNPPPLVNLNDGHINKKRMTFSIQVKESADKIKYLFNMISQRQKYRDITI